MPKQPSAPPSTALGVWLTGWLADHPEITHAALATDIGVSKGLISQWATGAVKTLEPPNLSGLARATDVELSFLEGLVYGSKAPARESMAAAIAAAVAEEMRPLLARVDRLIELLELDRGAR